MLKLSKELSKERNFHMMISEGGLDRIPFIFSLFVNFDFVFCEQVSIQYQLSCNTWNSNLIKLNHYLPFIEDFVQKFYHKRLLIKL